MPIYRNIISPTTISRYAANLFKELRLKATVIQPLNEEGDEAFLLTKEHYLQLLFNEEWIFDVLTRGGYMKSKQIDAANYLVFLNTKKLAYIPTVAGANIWMPRLSYFITLTTEDFFTLISLLAAAEPANSNTALALTANLQTTPYGFLFEPLKINYRLDPQYCSGPWVPLSAFATISKLPHTAESQLYAIQYLGALIEKEPLYFPLDSMIELGLEWEQMDDDYAVPPPRD